ncbi:MAG: hypothetical protein U5K72_16020 [Balneolaceae bacterium]|nr:hypothetical protein [Balneolaceae bacterium]
MMKLIKVGAKYYLLIFEENIDGQFQIIDESVYDYSELTDSSKKMIESGDFDLFLVDLRLKGDLEENLNTTKLSGSKIAKKIKTKNKGNQVVVFTASNKAWNMKALLEMYEDGYDIGVDGY